MTTSLATCEKVHILPAIPEAVILFDTAQRGTFYIQDINPGQFRMTFGLKFGN